MQAQTTFRPPDALTTLSQACLPSAASRHWSISTGKIRDAETGLDYFGARYYTGSVSRFMSPDWATVAMPIPYGSLDNPQSLNMYSYVLNNPMLSVDEDGHAGCKDTPELCRAVRDAVSAGHSIAEGWANRLNDIKWDLHKGVTGAKKALDTFNATLGFGKSNCAGGGSCNDAFGMALGSVVAAVSSEGGSELGLVDEMLDQSERKIGNIIGDHLGEEDLEGARREANGGMRIAKEGGGYWDHVNEVSQGINGLERQVRHLKRILGRSGLSESQIGRINGLLEQAGDRLELARSAIKPSI